MYLWTIELSKRQFLFIIAKVSIVNSRPFLYFTSRVSLILLSVRTRRAPVFSGGTPCLGHYQNHAQLSLQNQLFPQMICLVTLANNYKISLCQGEKSNMFCLNALHGHAFLVTSMRSPCRLLSLPYKRIPGMLICRDHRGTAVFFRLPQ